MADQSVTLTRVGVGDAGVVARLIHALLTELSGGTRAWDGAALEATAGELLRDGVVCGVLARVDGAPVGVLMLNECAATYAGGRFGEITELYVDPRYRSQGVAPKLLAEARAIAREKGWDRFEVGAPGQPTWNRTVDFYRREGFVEVGPRLRLVF